MANLNGPALSHSLSLSLTLSQSVSLSLFHLPNWYTFIFYLPGPDSVYLEKNDQFKWPRSLSLYFPLSLFSFIYQIDRPLFSICLVLAPVIWRKMTNLNGPARLSRGGHLVSTKLRII